MVASILSTPGKELTMRTSNLAKLVALSLLAVPVGSNAVAAHPALAEARHETIYLPNCWPEETRQQWLECATVPGLPGTIKNWRDLQ